MEDVLTNNSEQNIIGSTRISSTRKMSVYSLYAGRKRESTVWNYFDYDKIADISKCRVIVSEKECGKLMSGKNPSNLKKHIAAIHPDVVKQMDECELERIAGKRKREDDGML